jgi:VCBS repeat-containing protein
VNDAPNAVNDAGATNEDTVLNVAATGVLGNDSDPDTGDSLTVTAFDAVSVKGAAVSVAANGSYTYDPTGSATLNALALGATTTDTFTYTISDGKGGTDTATVTITVTGVNDAPTAAADTNTVAYNSTGNIAGNVLTNDTDPDTGDTLVVSKVQGLAGNVGSVVTGTYGAVTINSNGSYSYNLDEANPTVSGLAPGATLTDVYTYTASDGKGGTSQTTLSITIKGPNQVPTLSSNITSGLVYEAGLTEGTGIGATTTTLTGQLTYGDLDGDPVTLFIDGVNVGILDGLATTTLTPVWGEDSNGTLTVKGNGSWTYQLAANAVHDANDLTYIASELEDFVLRVEDGKGGVSPNVTLIVNIVDDGIKVIAPTPATINTVGATLINALTTTGADNDIYTASLTGNVAGWTAGTPFAFGGVHSAGLPVYFYVNPADLDTLIGYTDTATTARVWSGIAGQTKVFTLNANPNADTYDMTVHQALKKVTDYTYTWGTLSTGGGGPKESWSFTDFPRILDNTQSPNVGESVIFKASPIDFATDGGVNNSTQGMGLGNNWLDTNEKGVKVVFPSGNTDKVSLGLNFSGSGNTAFWRAYDSAGTTVIAEGVHTGGNGTLVIDTPAAIGRIDISANKFWDAGQMGDKFRVTFIAVVPVGVTGSNANLKDFTVKLTDSDGDTATTTFKVSVVAPAAAPIVVDLNHDGVRFNSIQEGIDFDVDEDGQLERIAWADNNDAVLIYDANNNNNVDGRNEFVFSDYSSNPGATDLEGLREYFDSNKDGILSAGDEKFSNFKLWQDKNGNGNVDEGEMTSLVETGIESIELVSDHDSYIAADGEVLVHGQMKVLYTDGSTGVAADAEFSYIELEKSDAATQKNVPPDVKKELKLSIAGAQGGKPGRVWQAGGSPILAGVSLREALKNLRKQAEEGQDFFPDRLFAGFERGNASEKNLNPFFAGVAPHGSRVEVMITDLVGSEIGRSNTFADAAGNWSLVLKGVQFEDQPYAVEISLSLATWEDSPLKSYRANLPPELLEKIMRHSSSAEKIFGTLIPVKSSEMSFADLADE